MGTKKVTVVLFHDDDSEDGGYSVVIPTIPQLGTMGDTVEHAFDMAKECLEISLEDPSDWDYYSFAQAYAEHVAVSTMEIEMPPRPGSTESKKDTGKLAKLTVVLVQNEAGGYTAIAPSFPHHFPQGKTVRDMSSAVKENLALNLQDPGEWDMFNLWRCQAEHIVIGMVKIEFPVRSNLPTPELLAELTAIGLTPAEED